MALLTGISGAVRANVAGMAGRAVKSASSTVKSIAGLNPEGSNSSLDTIAKTTRTGSSSILTYPLNVDNDPQMGHYILFHINTRTDTKIKSTRERKSIHDAARKLQKEMSIATGDEFAGLTQLGTTALDKVDPTKLSDAKGASGKLNRSIVLEKLPTSRLEKSIALYMPPSVQVEYKVGYGDQEVGVLAMAGMAAIEGFKGGGDTQTKLRNAINAATPGVKEALNAMAEKTIDTIAEGAATLMAIERGTVRTPRMEMMFEGVGRRTFSYEFTFTPKSEQEAKIIEEIIYHFKFYAMPKYSNPNTRREMDIPGTFDIQYMYRGGENSFINKISTCFCTNVGVEYGADRFTAYEPTSSKFGSGPPPQKSKLKLEFSEIEVLSQDHIALGY
jgi:hypothetical protein